MKTINKKIINHIYQILVICVYFIAGIYFIIISKDIQSAVIQKIMGYVIILYGVFRTYRILRRQEFKKWLFRKP
jgi:uncharacterized membrane protein HdeD (DUF308 family)